MNILIVNKYYYVTGGPERYMFSVIKLLKENGHNVIPLSINLPQNKHSEYEHYFLPSIFKNQVSQYKDAKLSVIDKIRLTARAVYYLTAKKRVYEIVKRENIDVVYLLNICNYISPSVIDGAKAAGASVVMRLSDFNFVCSSHQFFRNRQVCLDCQDNVINAIRHSCVHGSLQLSVLRVLTIKIHRVIGIYKKVDAFIAPSKFMAQALRNSSLSIDNKNIYCVPSFVDLKLYKPNYKRGNYVLYFGRLSTEKGIDVLLKSWQILGEKAPKLLVVGGGDDYERLLGICKNNGLGNVEFKPFVAQQTVIQLIRNCAFVVIPSLWHDNSPMVAYETMACGKPMIASKLGGLADQVEDNVSGFLVSPGEPEELASAVQKLWKNPELIRRFGMSARKRMEELFSPDNHLRSLEKIFNRCVSN